jgi:hypothetical protein
MRYAIAWWSNHVFALARSLRVPALYLGWARVVLRLYQSLTWSRGRLGKVLDRLMSQPER